MSFGVGLLMWTVLYSPRLALLVPPLLPNTTPA